MSPDERKAIYAELRENLAPVADYAGEHGVRIALEPLNRYETGLPSTVEQAPEALPDGCGLALPHEHRGEGSGASRTGRGGEDRARAGPRNRSRRPGRRPLRLARAFTQALRKAGYTGPLVVESFTAHNTIATAASVWRPLAPSQDALATKGLAFLRALWSCV